jgi:hypothetical protein
MPRDHGSDFVFPHRQEFARCVSVLIRRQGGDAAEQRCGNSRRTNEQMVGLFQ